MPQPSDCFPHIRWWSACSWWHLVSLELSAWHRRCKKILVPSRSLHQGTDGGIVSNEIRQRLDPAWYEGHRRPAATEHRGHTDGSVVAETVVVRALGIRLMSQHASCHNFDLPHAKMPTVKSRALIAKLRFRRTRKICFMNFWSPRFRSARVFRTFRKVDFRVFNPLSLPRTTLLVPFLSDRFILAIDVQQHGKGHWFNASSCVLQEKTGAFHGKIHSF